MNIEEYEAHKRKHKKPYSTAMKAIPKGFKIAAGISVVILVAAYPIAAVAVVFIVLALLGAGDRL